MRRGMPVQVGEHGAGRKQRHHARAQGVVSILVVDDDLDNLWALQLALEAGGHRVSLAGDARLALEILHRQSVQIIATDYEMPEIDGVELF